MTRKYNQHTVIDALEPAFCVPANKGSLRQVLYCTQIVKEKVQLKDKFHIGVWEYDQAVCVMVRVTSIGELTLKAHKFLYIYPSSPSQVSQFEAI